MSAEMNKEHSRRIAEEVFGKGKLSLIQELCLPDCVIHDADVPGGDLRGHAGFTQYVTGFRAAFPDLHVTVEDQIAQGDKVVTRYTVQGTNRGDFMGVAPTGKKVTMTGISLDRYANGRLAETWNHADSLSVMQQLGLVPAMAQSPARAER